MRFIVLYSMVATCFLTAGDWPRYGGPYGDGSAAAPGLFDDDVKLKQLWKVPLGSGFSSVVVSNGKVYAMHQAGDKDAMSSFDAKT